MKNRCVLTIWPPCKYMLENIFSVDFLFSRSCCLCPHPPNIACALHFTENHSFVSSFVGAKLAAVQIQSTPIHLLTNVIVVHISRAAKLYQHKSLAPPLANNVYVSTELKP